LLCVSQQTLFKAKNICLAQAMLKILNSKKEKQIRINSQKAKWIEYIFIILPNE